MESGSGMVLTSVAPVVMAHPSRSSLATGLSERVEGAVAVFDDAAGADASPLKTAVKAWRFGHGLGATHVLLLQDDVVPNGDLLQQAGGSVAAFPDACIAYYAHSISRNGARTHSGYLAGWGWVEAHPHEYFPCQAVSLPAEVAAHFAEWALSERRGMRADDVALRQYLSRYAVPALVATYPYVEHLDAPSLSGANNDIIRHATDVAYPISSSDVLAAPGVWQGFNQLRASMSVVTGDHVMARATRSAHLAYLRTSWRELQQIGSSTFYPALAKAVGRPITRVATEFALGALSLGAAARLAHRRDTQINDQVLWRICRSVVHDAFGLRSKLADWNPDLSALADGYARLVRSEMRKARSDNNAERPR